jgi:hypothetical protein
MNPRSFAVAVAAISTALLSPASAAIASGHGTFSGFVSRVLTTSITVSDEAHRSLRFLIAPTDGYGAVSPGGGKTYQMSAIRVGWHVKVEYDRTGSGKWHADHIFVLR